MKILAAIVIAVVLAASVAAGSLILIGKGMRAIPAVQHTTIRPTYADPRTGVTFRPARPTDSTFARAACR